MTAIRSTLAAAAFVVAAAGSTFVSHALAQTATPQAASATYRQAAAPALNIRQIHDRVEAAGYTRVRQIELEKHGYYEVKAQNAQGQRVKLHVNANTGDILIVKQSQNAAFTTAAPALNIAQIHDKLQAAGYSNIREIDFENRGFDEVKARDAQGQFVKLHVNAETGEVASSRVRD